MKKDYVTANGFKRAIGNISKRFNVVDHRLNAVETKTEVLDNKLNILHSEVQGLYPFISEHMGLLLEKINKIEANQTTPLFED